MHKLTRMITRPLLAIVAALSFCIEVSAQRIVCDETCKLADAPPAVAVPTVAAAAKPSQTIQSKAAAPSAKKLQAAPVKKEEPGFAVVSPVGRSSVEMIRQAARLGSLPRSGGIRAQ